MFEMYVWDEISAILTSRHTNRQDFRCLISHILLVISVYRMCVFIISIHAARSCPRSPSWKRCGNSAPPPQLNSAADLNVHQKRKKKEGVAEMKMEYLWKAAVLLWPEQMIRCLNKWKQSIGLNSAVNCLEAKANFWRGDSKKLAA